MDRMTINSDINVLGSIVDLNLIANLILYTEGGAERGDNILVNTRVQTTKSLQRYESAIRKTLLTFAYPEVKELFYSVYAAEGLSALSLALLFFNASYNNDLLNYLNQNVYFPAYFSGRIAIQKDEIIACLQDLSNREPALKKWSESTMNTTASKYLSLLSKFGYVQPSKEKSIIHQYFSDAQFVLFMYCLLKFEPKSNIIASQWLNYCLMDGKFLIDRIMDKKYMKQIEIFYTGDSLRIETAIPYKEIYNAIKNS